MPNNLLNNEHQFPNFQLNAIEQAQKQHPVAIEIPSHINPNNIIITQHGRIIEPLYVSTNFTRAVISNDYDSNDRNNYQSPSSNCSKTFSSVDLNERMYCMNLQPAQQFSPQHLFPASYQAKSPQNQDVSVLNTYNCVPSHNYMPQHCSNNVEQFPIMNEGNFNEIPILLNTINSDGNESLIKFPFGNLPSLLFNINSKTLLSAKNIFFPPIINIQHLSNFLCFWKFFTSNSFYTNKISYKIFCPSNYLIIF